MSYLSQFNHMVETHKCFSKHMLEQLQEVTYSNHRNLRRLEEQERNHKAFSHRSKCLTTQLEQDRERYVCSSLQIEVGAFSKATLTYHVSHSSILTYWKKTNLCCLMFVQDDLRSLSRKCEPVMVFITECSRNLVRLS